MILFIKGYNDERKSITFSPEYGIKLVLHPASFFNKIGLFDLYSELSMTLYLNNPFSKNKSNFISFSGCINIK